MNENKMVIPMEMDKHFAIANGIDPSELRTITYLDQKISVYFLEIENENVYREYTRPVEREKTAFRRSKRCLISNGKGKLVRCKKNCSECTLPQAGTSLPFNDAVNTGLSHLMNSTDSAISPEDIVFNAALKKELWHLVDKLPEIDQIIMRMFAQGATEREIAAEIGMSQKGVNKRKKKDFAILKNDLEKFI